MCVREEIEAARSGTTIDRSDREARFYARACQRLCLTRNTRTVLIIAWLINKTEERFESASLMRDYGGRLNRSN